MYKEIEGYPNYSINEFGEVKNNKTGRILKQIEKVSRNSGYMCVYLYNKDGRKSFFVQRVIVDNSNVFNSLTECAIYLGISLTQVYNIINGKRKSNHIIKYFEED